MYSTLSAIIAAHSAGNARYKVQIRCPARLLLHPAPSKCLRQFDSTAAAMTGLQLSLIHILTDLLDIPAIRQPLKELLKQHFTLERPRLVQQTDSTDTVKFLFALQDGSLIEAVLMRQNYGNSLCISSQVGCNMACAFCQSGRFKRVRNLPVSYTHL